MKNEFNKSRRAFITNTGKAGLAAGLSISALPTFAKGLSGNFPPFTTMATPYQQQPLPYGYTALEPVIDAMTMEIHYTKHAAAYAKNLADACTAENVNTTAISLETLLSGISKYSAKMRNNAGGHYNHELFWKSMAPQSSPSAPSGKLMKCIVKDFTTLDALKIQFNDAAKTRFGSGWAWLVYNSDKKLVIASTPNQDNPLMDVSEAKGFPVLGLDVWEHAYYLKYQNKRPDYIAAWWNIVNWDFIGKRFEEMM